MKNAKTNEKDEWMSECLNLTAFEDDDAMICVILAKLQH